MSGTGTFTKQGSGSITFGAVNTYTGLTTISDGKLALSGAGEISASSGVTLTMATAKFDISAATGGATIKDLNGVAGSELVLGNKALILGTSNNSTFNGLISGMGGVLFKDGTGTLSLTNTNTYTGGTTLGAGVVSISADNALGMGQVTFATGNLEASGSIMISNTAWLKFSGAIDIPVMADSLTMTGLIFGPGNLTKEGAGTLILNNPNTYSGATVINAGTLQLGVANALPAVTNVVLANVAGALLDLNDYSTTILSLSNGGTSGGNVHLGNMATTLTVSGNAITTYGGVISEAGSLVKGGGGTLTLTGTNLYTGSTTITGGTLALSGTGSIATSSAVNVNASGAVFDISAGPAVTTIQDLSGVVGSSVKLGTKALIAGTSNNTVFSGVMSGSGAFTKQNSGEITFDGVNTYTGITTITGGTLALSGSGSIAASSSVVVNATLDIVLTTSGALVNNLTGAGTGSILLGNKVLVAIANSDTTFSGVISGMGQLVKSGEGTLALAGANIYSGSTTIDNGTLQIQAAAALPVGTDVIIENSPTTRLDLNNISSTIGSLSGGGVIGGNVQLGSGTLTFGNTGTQTYSGQIFGTGGIVKQGMGTAILKGWNQYSGGTTVALGTLQGNSISLQGNIDIMAPGTLTFDQQNNGTYSGVLTGSGALIKQNTGTLTISGASPGFMGTVAINQGTTLVNGNLQGAFTVTAPGILGGTGTTGSVINNGIVAPGASIGTLTVNGNYTQTGTLQIEMDSTGASDLLQVNGTAALGGILEVFLAPGTYLNGTQFQIITSTGTCSGTFSNAEVGTPFLRSYGQLFLTDYQPNQVLIFTITDFFVLNSGNPPNPFSNYFFCDSFVFGNKQLVDLAQAISVLEPYEFAIASSKMGPGQFGALPILDMENNIRISNTFFDWFDLANCCELQVEEKPKKRTSHFRRKENRGTTAYPQFNIRFTPIGFVYSQTKTEDDLPKFNTSTQPVGGVSRLR
jgi:autotransporter-associated beta strand protein